VPQPVAGCVDDPEFSGWTRSVDQRPGIGERDDIIIGTVHHKERTRWQFGRRSNRIEGLEFPLPGNLIDGILRIRNESDCASMFEETPRLAHPIAQACRRAPRRHPTNPIINRGFADR
jgi:hypothetical protein